MNVYKVLGLPKNKVIVQTPRVGDFFRGKEMQNNVYCLHRCDGGAGWW